MIRAILQFHAGNARTWSLTKDFKDEQHIDNFIAYIKRKKGYELDELWIEKTEQ